MAKHTIDRIVADAKPGNPWAPDLHGLDKKQQAEARDRLLAERSLRPCCVGGDHSLLAGCRLGDPASLAALADYLAERNIPRPPRLKDELARMTAAEKVKAKAAKQPAQPVKRNNDNLYLSRIKADRACQQRVEMDPARVEEYRLALEQGATLPRVTVYYDGDNYWLADGFYRVAAHKKHGRTAIRAEVYFGDRRAALLHSCSVNATHGLPRTNADKRKAVTVLLTDAEWGKWANREIARRCAVGEWLVRQVREELSACDTQIADPLTSASAPKSRIGAPSPASQPKPADTRTVQRNGTQYTMDVGNIGTPPPAPAAPRPPTGKPAVVARMAEQLAANQAAERAERAEASADRHARRDLVGALLRETQAEQLVKVLELLPALSGDDRKVVREELDRLDGPPRRK